MFQNVLFARAKSGRAVAAGVTAGALALGGLALGAGSANADVATAVVYQPNIGAETASSYPINPWFVGYSSIATRGTSMNDGDLELGENTQLLYQLPTPDTDLTALVNNGLSAGVDGGDMTFQIVVTWAGGGFTTLRSTRDEDTTAALDQPWVSSKPIDGGTGNTDDTLGNLIADLNTVSNNDYSIDAVGVYGGVSAGTPTDISFIQFDNTKYTFASDVAVAPATSTSVVQLGTIGAETDAGYPTASWFYGDNHDKTSPHGYISGPDLVLTSGPTSGTQLLHQFTNADRPASLDAFINSGLSFTVAASPVGTASFQIPLVYGPAGSTHFVTLRNATDLGAGVHNVSYADNWTASHDIGSTISQNLTYTLAQITAAIDAAGGTQVLAGFGLQNTTGTTPAIASIQAEGTSYSFTAGGTSLTPSLSALDAWTSAVSASDYDWSAQTYKGVASLQMSNWVSDPSLYGNITELSSPAIAAAGKPGVSGAEYNTFTANYTVTAKTFAAQPGLAVEISADKGGDRSGGSILLRHDSNNKLTLTNFSVKPGATDDDVTDWVAHTATVPFTKPVAIKFVDHFNANSSDTVTVSVNGVVVLHGGTYDGYEAIEGETPGTVNSLLFRAGHTKPGAAGDPNAWESATPTPAQIAAVKGNGFYFSKISYASTNVITESTPVISGDLRVGGTVAAAAATDVSGTTPTYQWYANGMKITGATADEYKIAPSHLGQRLSVKVTETEPTFATVSATSPLSAKVIAGSFSAGTVTISGTPAVGQKLTAVASATPAAKFTYQWYRGSSKIGGATGSTRTLTAADLGSTITVQATAHAPAYFSQVETSLPTVAVAMGSFTLSATTLTGTFAIGKTVTAHSTASVGGVSKLYEFYIGDPSDGALLKSSSSASYKIPAYLKGSTITVIVLAFAPGFWSNSEQSAASATIS